MFGSVPLFTEDLYLRARANALRSLLSYITYQPRQQVTSSQRELLPCLRMKSILHLQKTQIIQRALWTEEIVQIQCLGPGPEAPGIGRAAVIYVSELWGTEPSTCASVGELISPRRACQSHQERAVSWATFYCRIGRSLTGWHPGSPVTWRLGYPYTLLLLINIWRYRNISRMLSAVSDGAPLAWGTQADILLNGGGVWERNPSEK